MMKFKTMYLCEISRRVRDHKKIPKVIRLYDNNYYFQKIENGATWYYDPKCDNSLAIYSYDFYELPFYHGKLMKVEVIRW